MNDNAVLRRHRLLRTDDVEEFRSGIAGSLTPHTLHPVAPGIRLDAELSVARLGAMSLVFARHRGGELAAELTDRVSYYDIHLAHRGHNSVMLGDDTVVVHPGRAAILSPRTVAKMRLSSEYSQLHVRIERSALERHLEGLVGRPVTGPVLFEPGMDLTAPAAASWLSAVRTVVRDLDRVDGLSIHPLAVAGWSELLMTGLLLAQHHNYSRLLEEPRSFRSPRTVSRALEYIEDHLCEPIGVGDIATAAGVSARSLQREFRECLGQSPAAYVRQQRLTKVHDELRSATPGSDLTVTDTALRWGFTHGPRFAAAYRERYGVAPSVTLRRSSGPDHRA